MIRKLVRQGKGALTVSLPKSWIDFNGLNFGDEVFIDDIDNNLIIKNILGENSSSIDIELNYLNKEAYRSIVGGLYRAGYDIINVKFSDKKVISNLETAVNSLYGFELFYESGNKCVIKSIYNSEDTDIKDHYNRIIYTIKTMQNLILEGKFDELLTLRNNVLKQRDLIIRIIKKKKLLDNKNFPFYSITLSLWGVTRNYYHMCKDLVSLDDISLIKSVNEYFNESFAKIEISYSSFLERHKKYDVIYKKCLKSKSKVSAYCLGIIMQIQLVDSSIYLLNFG